MKLGQKLEGNSKILKLGQKRVKLGVFHYNVKKGALFRAFFNLVKISNRPCCS